MTSESKSEDSKEGMHGAALHVFHRPLGGGRGGRRSKGVGIPLLLNNTTECPRTVTLRAVTRVVRALTSFPGSDVLALGFSRVYKGVYKGPPCQGPYQGTMKLPYMTPSPHLNRSKP